MDHRSYAGTRSPTGRGERRGEGKLVRRQATLKVMGKRGQSHESSRNVRARLGGSRTVAGVVECHPIVPCTYVRRAHGRVGRMTSDDFSRGNALVCMDMSHPPGACAQVGCDRLRRAVTNSPSRTSSEASVHIQEFYVKPPETGRPCWL